MFSKRGFIYIFRTVSIRICSILLLASVFLILGEDEASANLKWDFLYGEHENDDIGNPVRNNIIFFENDRVETGIPLKVLGAPEGSTYIWTIRSADKTENTFTTTDNIYTPVEADMEKLFIVTIEGLEEANAAIYFSALLVIYLNNDTGYYSVNDEYSEVVMSMQGNEEYSSPHQFYSGDVEIKLRGNSTRYREKRPFNMKLDKKANLLGMGENKRWALLANDIDHTLMRNKLLYDFSGAIGMDTYMKSENVILIFNNQYYGVYQLCESITIGAERVDIYDWEESAEAAAEAIADQLEKNGELTSEDVKKVADDLTDQMCIDLSWISSPYTVSYDVNQDGVTESYIITDYLELPEATGGALVEIDPNSYGGLYPSVMITAYAQPLNIKTPEYAITNKALYEYTQKYLQAFEYALHSTDFMYHENDKKYRFLNEYVGAETPRYEYNVFNAPEYEGKHYSELFDLDSLVQNFLVCEFSMNVDSMRCSVFMYKDVDDIFHMGPVWDFDWAFGNINMFDVKTWYPTSWHTTEKALDFETVQWNQSIIRDPYFITKVYEKYKAIRGTVIEDMIKGGGTIDNYEEYLKNPAEANDAKWNYTYKKYKSVGFDESMKNMRAFLTERINWLDGNFESLESLMVSLGYYLPNTELMVAKVDTASFEDYAEITAVVTNPDISKITFQVNGTHMYSEEVVDGQVVCKVPVMDLISEEEQLNVIQIHAKNAADKYIIGTLEDSNYYNSKSNYAVFYSNEGYVNTEAVEILDNLIEAALQEEEALQEDAVNQEVANQPAKQAGNHTVLIIVIVVISLALAGLAAVFIWRVLIRK